MCPCPSRSRARARPVMCGRWAPRGRLSDRRAKGCRRRSTRTVSSTGLLTRPPARVSTRPPSTRCWPLSNRRAPPRSTRPRSPGRPAMAQRRSRRPPADPPPRPPPFAQQEPTIAQAKQKAMGTAPTTTAASGGTTPAGGTPDTSGGTTLPTTPAADLTESQGQFTALDTYVPATTLTGVAPPNPQAWPSKRPPPGLTPCRSRPTST